MTLRMLQSPPEQQGHVLRNYTKNGNFFKNALRYLQQNSLGLF